MQFQGPGSRILVSTSWVQRSRVLGSCILRSWVLGSCVPGPGSLYQTIPKCISFLIVWYYFTSKENWQVPCVIKVKAWRNTYFIERKLFITSEKQCFCFLVNRWRNIFHQGGRENWFLFRCIHKAFMVWLHSTLEVLFDDQSVFVNWILTWIPVPHLEPRQMPMMELYVKNLKLKAFNC